MVQSTFKSKDTEENIDIYFTRPCGLVLTLFYKALGFHPNVVTLIGIAVGICSAYFFCFEDLQSNIIAALLLTFANFHDSADGQLARMTGKKSLIGRMLDGVSADAIFIFIYLALVFRMYNSHFLGCTADHSEAFCWQCACAFLLCAAAGILGHSRQCYVADYYRQLHLLFLKGQEHAEYDTSESQFAIAKQCAKEKRWLDWAFYYNYARYCRRQEKKTPKAQMFLKKIASTQENATAGIRQEFLKGSFPLLKWTNFLTYNWRAIFLFTACLLNIPWLYPVAELTLFAFIREYMIYKHEHLCEQLTEKIGK